MTLYFFTHIFGIVKAGLKQTYAYSGYACILRYPSLFVNVRYLYFILLGTTVFI